MGRTSSAVYNINYHIVWCPKYRKPILKGDVKEFVEEQLKTIAETKGWKIEELEVMPDHIHMFISAPPFESPTAIVKVVKGVTARRIFDKFPHLRKVFRRGSVWSPSYYVGTAGHVSAETIKKYIAGVKNRGCNSSTD
ncbi:MAG: IS200/IS605 family transposase [Candidatus Aenigmatarchaeota archaeon]|nr:MAG: IS200/IS605 family transposase [Candidatus Aenigmarchaeota archaeon]